MKIVAFVAVVVSFNLCIVCMFCIYVYVYVWCDFLLFIKSLIRIAAYVKKNESEEKKRQGQGDDCTLQTNVK